MEHIIVEIQKLGRVVDSTIEIHPLMIFSGESGMGKSYLALLSHYFFDVLINSERQTRLAYFFDALNYDYREMVKDFHGTGQALSLTKKEIESWMEKDAIAYLRFMLNSESLDGDIKVKLPSSVPDNMSITYTEVVEGLLNNEKKEIVLSLDNIHYRVTQSAINDGTPYASVLSAKLIECLHGKLDRLQSTFNMPPSRGPVLSENVSGNSGMYKDFIADVNDLSNVPSNPNPVSEPLMNQLRLIMEGEVKKKDNRYFYATNDIEIPISAAASSIREIAPLQIMASRWDISRAAVLIEEPEAHLHPDKQRMMADIVGCILKSGGKVHLTTHSDYFLRRVNELILFRRYADNHTKEDVAKLSEATGIDISFSIDAGDSVAYLVQRQADGHSKAIVQDLKHGVPFTAFSSAVRDSMRINDILEEVLEL